MTNLGILLLCLLVPFASPFTPIPLSQKPNIRKFSNISPLNDIAKRITRLGKEKLGDANQWINQAANPDGPNLR